MTKQKLKDHQKRKNTVILFGLFLTILGWMISSSNYLSIMNPIFAPKYSRAMKAFEKLDRLRIIKMGDKGFQEISNLFWKEYLKTRNGGNLIGWQPKITQIEFLDAGISISNKLDSLKDRIGIRIHFSDLTNIEGDVSNLEENIKERFLKRRLFILGAIVFWSGIMASTLDLVFRRIGLSIRYKNGAIYFESQGRKKIKI